VPALRLLLPHVQIACSRDPDPVLGHGLLYPWRCRFSPTPKAERVSAKKAPGTARVTYAPWLRRNR
jgi:hypothetical protein